MLRSTLATGPDPSRPPPPREPARGAQTVNILIVDDEPSNLDVLESLLHSPDYRLVRAQSAEQALLALETEEFALLILDVHMPGMTGIELARIIKERKKTAEVPIIFLTAYFRQDQHILDGYGAGAVDYLYKPVTPSILRSKVAVFAELHRKNNAITASNDALLAEVSKRRQAEEQLQVLNATLERLVVERTQALREKEVLLHEVHHRVKNNLQLVCSLLNLQRSQLTDPTLIDAFTSTSNRVHAMAGIHQHLYQSGRFAEIDLTAELETLAGMLIPAHSPPGSRIRSVLVLERAIVSLNDALPLTLIASELITNALKYAFVGGRQGVLEISLRADGQHYELSVADDGPGLPATNGAPSLGLELVRTLSEQIGAELAMSTMPGVRIAVRWPIRPRLGSGIPGPHPPAVSA